MDLTILAGTGNGRVSVVHIVIVAVHSGVDAGAERVLHHRARIVQLSATIAWLWLGLVIL